jgi:integration host factor subunit alpha
MSHDFEDAAVSGSFAPEKRRNDLALEDEPTRNTLTRADLAECLRKAVGLSFAESADLVEMVLDEILDTIVSGEDVKLSSFGSFVVRSKKERSGRNPKTGEAAKITARRVVIFKPSNVLRARVNGERRPR